MAMRNTNAAMADSGHNSATNGSSMAMNATRTSRPIAQANAEPIRSPLPGGAPGNRGGGVPSRGSVVSGKATAPKKPKGGNMYKNNKTKPSFGMAGASASEGRARSTDPKWRR